MPSGGKKIEGAAGAAGVAGGTSFVGFAGLIPDTYPLIKNALIYAAPGASVVIALAWIFIKYYVRKQIAIRQLDAAILNTRAMRDEIHVDPLSSKDLKDLAQQQVEELQKLRIKLIQDETSIVIAELKEIIK